MTTKSLALALLVAALWLPSAAPRADQLATYQAMVEQNCAAEIKAHCEGVPVGNARVLACLYGFQDRLSGACLGAVLTASERLAIAVDALAVVEKDCADDAAELCPGIAKGDGRIIDCLNQVQSRVSARCNAAIDGAYLR